MNITLKGALVAGRVKGIFLLQWPVQQIITQFAEDTALTILVDSECIKNLIDLGAFHTIERQEGAKAGGLPASHLSKSIPRVLASVKLTQQEGRKVGPVKFLKQWKLIEAPSL